MLIKIPLAVNGLPNAGIIKYGDALVGQIGVCNARRISISARVRLF